MGNIENIYMALKVKIGKYNLIKTHYYILYFNIFWNDICNSSPAMP